MELRAKYLYFLHQLEYDSQGNARCVSACKTFIQCRSACTVYCSR